MPIFRLYSCVLSQSWKTVKRDVFNPVERNKTRLKSPLSWKPRTTLLSFLILIIFTGSLSGRRWFLPGPNTWSRVWFCRQAPLPISGTNSQQSLVPTSINTAKTIPRNTPAASSIGKKEHVPIFDQSDHWERQASNVRNPICINNVDVSQAYRKCKRKILVLPLLQATTA